MIHVFYRNRNTIGQFMVALMFLGTFGFLFTYDGFVSKSEATSCCCSGEAVVTFFAADSSGDFGSDTPVDTLATSDCSADSDIDIFANGNGPCNCTGTNCGNACNRNLECSGNNKPGCKDGNSCSNTDSCSCDGRICGKKSQCSGSGSCP